MLGLAVQPPPQAQRGVPLYPPIAASLSSETSIYEELSQTWAVATLIQDSGDILYDQLGGKVADSAHPLPETGHSHSHSRHGHHHSHGHGQRSGSSSSGSQRDRAYFIFPDLVIYEPGHYKIRVSLMQMDFSSSSSPEGMVTVREYVDSRSIVVAEEEASRSRPSELTLDTMNEILRVTRLSRTCFPASPEG